MSINYFSITLWLFFSVWCCKTQPCLRRSQKLLALDPRVASAVGAQTATSGDARNALGALAMGPVPAGWSQRGQMSLANGPHHVRGVEGRGSVAAPPSGTCRPLRTSTLSAIRLCPAARCGRSFRTQWASAFPCALIITCTTITIMHQAPRDHFPCCSGPNARSTCQNSCRTSVRSRPNRNWRDVGTL